MIIDAFQIMSREGFRIGDYRYTGFGSVSFVDFILFHRILGIDRMTSVEHDENIRKRIEFNKPFGRIEIRFGSFSNYISEFDPDLGHIVWLDYDFIIDEDVISDVSLTAAQLSVGSIFLVTVDVEPPKTSDEGPDGWFAYFDDIASSYFNLEWSADYFTLTNLPTINVQLIYNAIREGLAARSNVEFAPVFNFLYKDGHLMATVGGVIVGRKEKRMLDACDFSRASYVRKDLNASPYFIRVPRVTRKERLALDAVMPCSDGWKPKEFELSDEDVTAYREIYRFFPSYAELLLG